MIQMKIERKSNINGYLDFNDTFRSAVSFSDFNEKGKTSGK